MCIKLCNFLKKTKNMLIVACGFIAASTLEFSNFDPYKKVDILCDLFAIAEQMTHIIWSL